MTVTMPLVLRWITSASLVAAVFCAGKLLSKSPFTGHPAYTPAADSGALSRQHRSLPGKALLSPRLVHSGNHNSDLCLHDRRRANTAPNGNAIQSDLAIGNAAAGSVHQYPQRLRALPAYGGLGHLHRSAHHAKAPAIRQKTGSRHAVCSVSALRKPPDQGSQLWAQSRRHRGHRILVRQKPLSKVAAIFSKRLSVRSRSVDLHGRHRLGNHHPDAGSRASRASKALIQTSAWSITDLRASKWLKIARCAR